MFRSISVSKAWIFTCLLVPFIVLILGLQIAYAGDNNGEGLPQIENLSVETVSLNGQEYVNKTYNQISLVWDSLGNNQSYTVYYKKAKNQDSYEEYATVKDSSCTVKNLKSNTKYQFYVVSSSGAKSQVLSASTFTKTTGYFYYQVLVSQEWPGILLTSTPATEKEIQNFTNVSDQSSLKPAVKYEFCSGTKTLYIHVSAEFLGDDKDELMKKVIYNSSTKSYRSTGTYKKTYYELFLEAIDDCWNITVSGSSYDFVSGVSFKTKVVFHDFSNDPSQEKVVFRFGDACSELSSGVYWFYTAKCARAVNGVAEYQYISSNKSVKTVHLPSQSQLIANVENGYSSYHPMSTMTEYKECAAHEFGHILGLADAYPCESGNGTSTVRCLDSPEIISMNSTKKSSSSLASSSNIMIGNTYEPPANSNDVEMILQAQGDAINKVTGSFQAYRQYQLDGITYKLSSAIRSK